MGIAARGVASKAPTAIRIAGGADRRKADRRDRPRPRVRDALQPPAGGERGGGDHRGDEGDREQLDLEDERDQGADGGELDGSPGRRRSAISVERPSFRRQREQRRRARRSATPHSDLQDAGVDREVGRDADRRTRRSQLERRVGDRVGQRAVVGGDDHGEVALRERGDGLGDHVGGLGVERRGGLVEQDRVGVAGQGPRERDAGALAAGERAGGARRGSGIEAGGGERGVACVVGAGQRSRRRGCPRPCRAASPGPARRARRGGAGPAVAMRGCPRRRARSCPPRARRAGSGSAAACSSPRRTRPPARARCRAAASKLTSRSTTRSPRRTVRPHTSIPPFIPCSFTRQWP